MDKPDDETKMGERGVGGDENENKHHQHLLPDIHTMPMMMSVSSSRRNMGNGRTRRGARRGWKRRR